MQALVDATKSGVLKAHPAILITNNRNSQAGLRAESEGIPFRVLNSVSHPDPDSLDQAMLDSLREHGVDVIVLAGFMKKIGRRVLEAYDGRILNIHPSLLPKFGGQGMYGQHVHRAVIEARETLTGVSIHLVSGEYDKGRLIGQAEVPVLSEDTVESLAARVLIREHEFLVETLVGICEGTIRL